VIELSVNDPVANFDRSGTRRRGNAESTGRPWTESTGTVRRHDEESIRRPRPALRAAVCLRGSGALEWVVFTLVAGRAAT
jgi:hypothetical protein